MLTGGDFSLPAGNAPADPVSLDIMHQAEVIPNQEAKKRFQRNRWVQTFLETPKIQSGKSGIVRKGVQKSGRAVLTQVEGGEEANEALSMNSTAGYPASRIREKRKTAQAEKLKARRTDGKLGNKQYQKESTRKKKGIKEKQNKQAVRQRKKQYVIDKLTGSENQDSLGKTEKDILRMKSSAVMVMQIYLSFSPLRKEIGQPIKNTSSGLLESFRRHTVTDEDVSYISRYTTVYLE